MKQLHILSLIIVGSFLISCIGVKPKDPESKNNKIWEKISSYFKPPVAYENVYGNYRSPLLFYNGDTVKTKKDWKQRRSEIRSKWMDMMGEWPPIMTNQKLEILDTVQHDNFTQHKVRFFWTPNQQTEGYLLIPNTKGPKPAVITVFYEPETAIGLSDKANRDFAYQLKAGNLKHRRL